MSANSEVLALVQQNPEISTNNATYVSRLVDTAIEYVIRYCSLPAFPVLTQGYSQGRATPSTNLTALASNILVLSVNGSGFYQVEITLANCTTGAATAAEVQTQIRACGIDSVYEPTEVSCAYGTYYTVTSGQYGERSSIKVGNSYETTYNIVARAMGLSPQYGGVEAPGMAADNGLIRATALIVEHLYNRLGFEGAAQAAIAYDTSVTDADIDPRVKHILQQRRRMW